MKNKFEVLSKKIQWYVKGLKGLFFVIHLNWIIPFKKTLVYFSDEVFWKAFFILSEHVCKGYN